jgi:hypothetical protein
MSKACVALALFAASGVGLFWFSTWKLEVGKIASALIAASSIASILYVPCFCFHLYETRSIRESFYRAIEFWIEVFLEIFSSID